MSAQLKARPVFPIVCAKKLQNFPCTGSLSDDARWSRVKPWLARRLREFCCHVLGKLPGYPMHRTHSSSPEDRTLFTLNMPDFFPILCSIGKQPLSSLSQVCRIHSAFVIPKIVAIAIIWLSRRSGIGTSIREDNFPAGSVRPERESIVFS